MTWLRRRLWRHGFHAGLRHTHPAMPDYRAWRRETAGLANRYAMPGTDAQSAANREMAAGLLAAVLMLADAGLSRAQARQATHEALLRTGAWLPKLLMRLWLSVTRDPLATMGDGRELLHRTRALWGNGMTLAVEHGRDDLTLHVTACPFAEYFWNAAAPDLTPSFCAYDAIWMDVINASARPVAVSRPGTLARGCDSCAFRFVRVPARQAHRAPIDGHRTP